MYKHRRIFSSDSGVSSRTNPEPSGINTQLLNTIGGEDGRSCNQETGALIFKFPKTEKTDSTTDNAELTSLSDLIAKSLLTTVSLSTRDGLMSGGITDRVESGAIAPQTDNFAFTDDITKRVFLSGTVGTQEALVLKLAAEHGTSILLAKYLQERKKHFCSSNGGSPVTKSRMHNIRWVLLQLAAGCGGMGGILSFGSSRSRPEPDCKDAGGNPNVSSSPGGYTPLMGAALTGSVTCCWLLLRAGARLDAKSDGGKTALDFAALTRGLMHHRLMCVLHSPPPITPRSPYQVSVQLLDRSPLEDEDSPICVEVSWSVPSQKMLPVRCGDAERYVIKCWCQGQVSRVMEISASDCRQPRRDFCRNQIMDRGVGLRKNLGLPSPPKSSTVISNLHPGCVYCFILYSTNEVDGTLRNSPPSNISKPITIPQGKDEHQWSVGGVLSKMTGGGGREGNTGTSSMTPAQTLSAIASESPLLSVPNNVKLESEGSTQLQEQQMEEMKMLEQMLARMPDDGLVVENPLPAVPLHGISPQNQNSPTPMPTNDGCALS